MFVRGGDNGLWYKAWVAGTGWPDYTRWAARCCPRRASRTAPSGGYIDTYYRGAGQRRRGAVLRPRPGWSEENTTALGARQDAAAPALLARTPDVLDVIVRGTDDGLYRNWWNGSAWSGWIGDPRASRPRTRPPLTTPR